MLLPLDVDFRVMNEFRYFRVYDAVGRYCGLGRSSIKIKSCKGFEILALDGILTLAAFISYFSPRKGAWLKLNIYARQPNIHMSIF